MLCKKLTIRSSKKKDLDSINKIEKKAFGRKAEAKLVRLLIEASTVTLSFIAECDKKVVGHVLLSEIKAPVKALALAPLAVLPKYREMQIGSQLVRHAIEAATNQGFDAVFVLGDALFYERFGFSSTLADPFKTEWQSKNFLVLELKPNALHKKAGELVYPPAFNSI